jgi:uncharacterized protein
MGNANIETIQRVYEAFGRGDVDAILGVLTDDIDWASEASVINAPWHGVRKSKTEVAGFFASLGETIDVLEFTPLAFAATDDHVMVVIRFEMKVRATGRSGVMELHHWWRLRDGKVWRYRGTEDTALVASLL